jgi:hypothetical protein
MNSKIAFETDCMFVSDNLVQQDAEIQYSSKCYIKKIYYMIRNQCSDFAYTYFEKGLSSTGKYIRCFVRLYVRQYKYVECKPYTC